MIVHKIDNLQADVTIPKAEAQVLHAALTIAKQQIGPALLLGEHGRKAGVDIEHMLDILKGIIG